MIKEGIFPLGRELIEKYGQPPAVKFRMLVGYPARPLDFREINISMQAPLPGGLPPYIMFEDSKGLYAVSPGFAEMLQRIRKDLNDKLIEFHFGPEKD